MKNVLIPLAPGFEEIEAITIIDILRRSGARVSIAGIIDGVIEGSRGVKLYADESINNVNSKNFDLIVLHGGQPGVDNLKNDPRVLDKSTQKLYDFQPLCKHCNMLKKSASQARNKTNKRIGATKYGYNIDFITGDENFDRNDPNWYIGTYWGDVIEFKKSLRK